MRVPQRTQTDCVICTVAMVMGPYYDYDRVLSDSSRYPKISSEGKFSAWWETYLRDEGFECVYCHFDGLYALGQSGGDVVGIMGMDIPHRASGHVVAVDKFGVVDPADNAPERVAIAEYVHTRLLDGVVFHPEWLAIRKKPAL